MSIGWLDADWPAPAHVRAGTTTRCGGVSLGSFSSLNLGDHVGDEAQAVAENRRRLRAGLDLPSEPYWLQQVHGSAVLDASRVGEGRCADGVVAPESGAVCAVLTADCLPVVFCDRAGTRVAAAHAGWRGLAGGVLEATLERLRVPSAQVMAWLGPAIGPAHFEVGEEVRDTFVSQADQLAAAFEPARPGHWLADLYTLARVRLGAQGVTRVYGGGRCAYRESQHFFSFRRDGGVTGRMATLIWMVPH